MAKKAAGFARQREAELSDGDASILEEAAAWYYDVAELKYVDSTVDPDDHVGVIRRAFAYSGGANFADELHRMTGWPIVSASWADVADGFGRNTLVRESQDRFLDVTGWTSRAAMARRYGVRVEELILTDAPPDDWGPIDEEQKARIVSVIRALPYLPFCDEDFRTLICADFLGAMPN